MRLLDSPLPYKVIKNMLESVEGNICRLSVSDDTVEIASSLGFAIDRLSTIAYSRIKEIASKEEI